MYTQNWASFNSNNIRMSLVVGEPSRIRSRFLNIYISCVHCACVSRLVIARRSLRAIFVYDWMAIPRYAMYLCCKRQKKATPMAHKNCENDAFFVCTVMHSGAGSEYGCCCSLTWISISFCFYLAKYVLFIYTYYIKYIWYNIMFSCVIII